MIREDLLLRETAMRTMIGLSFLVSRCCDVTVMAPRTAMAAITFRSGRIFVAAERSAEAVSLNIVERRRCRRVSGRSEPPCGAILKRRLGERRVSILHYDGIDEPRW